MISEKQYAFVPGTSGADVMFVLRMLMEKYRGGQKE